jgi:hypothetical protein
VKHSRLLVASICLSFVVPSASIGQVVHFPDSATNTGASNTQPFGPTQATAGYTNIHVYPAATLAAQGVTAGAVLVDLAIVPYTSAGSGTFNSTNFRYYVGHVATNPTIANQWLANMTAPTTLWDTTVNGPISFSWAAATWSSLPIACGGTPFVWDGVTDVAVMYVNCAGFTGGFLLTTAPTPANYPRHGVAACDPPPGTAQGTTGTLGARCRMTFAVSSCFLLSGATTGGGTGDLSLTVMNPPVGITEGFTLVTSSPVGIPGSGPMFGIWPDAVTFQGIAFPAGVGNPLHFVAGVPGVYPDAPLILPPGTLSFLGGQVWDLVVVGLAPNFVYLNHTNVARMNW